MFSNYISLLRVNHWFKNVSIIPGAYFAIVLHKGTIDFNTSFGIIVAFVLVSGISSVNYIVNQIADIKFDAKHPDKKNRPLPSGKVSLLRAGQLAAVLLIVCMIIGYFAYNLYFFYTLILLWLAGIVYNVRPIRFKDVPYIDVISESFNNPVRFLLGWFAVTSFSIPHLAILLFTWALGAILMTAKRYDELRFYGKNLVPYRYTFNTYSLNKLLAMMFVYALLSSLTLAYSVYIYQPSMLPGIPFVTMFLLWVIKRVTSSGSRARNIEMFVFDRRFIFYSISLVLFFIYLVLSR